MIANTNKSQFTQAKKTGFDLNMSRKGKRYKSGYELTPRTSQFVRRF